MQDLEPLFHAIVDKFEPGTPVILAWSAWLVTKDYEKQAMALVDRIIPKGFIKIGVIHRPDISDPLTQMSYFGFMDWPEAVKFRRNMLDEFVVWSKSSMVPHHDIFVQYLKKCG